MIQYTSVVLWDTVLYIKMNKHTTNQKKYYIFNVRFILVLVVQVLPVGVKIVAKRLMMFSHT